MLYYVGVAAGALIGGIGGAAGVAILLGLLAAFLIYRRKQKKEAEVQKGVVTDYVNFRDGLDADEMQRSGVF